MQKSYSRLLFSALLLLQFYSFAQPKDIAVLKHQFYTSYFSTTQHIPVVIEYVLTRDMFICDTKIKRTNKFAVDPLLSDATNLKNDYKGSGYDRGHNMSAADNACSEQGMRECFYFSNMTPQPHFFNAGTWEDLERQERKYAETEKIIVFTGSLGKNGTIGVDEVTVPQYMWKVIFFPQRTVDAYECYFFPDSTEAVKPYTLYKVSKETIEERAKLRFNGEGFVFVE